MKLDMLKTLTESMFGLFAATNIFSTPVGQAAGWEEMLSKIGALGLCAFMVLQNYRQQEALARVVARKDEQVNELTKSFLQAIQRHTDALNNISDMLRTRPCVIGDSRLDKHQEGA